MRSDRNRHPGWGFSNPGMEAQYIIKGLEQKVVLDQFGQLNHIFTFSQSKGHLFILRVMSGENGNEQLKYSLSKTWGDERMKGWFTYFTNSNTDIVGKITIMVLMIKCIGKSNKDS